MRKSNSAGFLLAVTRKIAVFASNAHPQSQAPDGQRWTELDRSGGAQHPEAAALKQQYADLLRETQRHGGSGKAASADEAGSRQTGATAQ
jgi:hypothetical protein